MHTTAHPLFSLRSTGRRAVSTGTVILLATVAAGCAGAGNPTAEAGPATTTKVTTSAPTPDVGSGSSTTPTTSGRTPTSPAGTTPAATSTPDIRRVDFRNMTYPSDTCVMGGIAYPPAGGYPLNDGRWDGDTFDYVAIESDIRYGDVTGDGHDDAVVGITCSTGVGSGTYVHPWVYTSDSGSATKVRRLPFPALTDAVLTQVGLAGSYTRAGGAIGMDGTLTLLWTVWTADDMPPGPSKRVETHQRWNGKAWETTGLPVASDRQQG